jgi:hypothetical protein
MFSAMSRGLGISPGIRGSPVRLTPFQPSLDPAMALPTAPGNLATGCRVGVEHLAHGFLHPDFLSSLSGCLPPMSFSPSMDPAHALATSPGDEACVSRVRVEPLTSGHASVVRSSKATYEEQIKGLKTKLAVSEKQNRAMRLSMHHSGAFDADGTDGLVTRGRPVECESKIAVRRMKAANTAVQMSTLLQGKDIASNVIHFVKAAAAIDATVLDKLAGANLIPERMEEVADKRFKSGKRLKVSKIVPMRNAFLWQAKSRANKKVVKELRRLGGKALIDTPEQLQQWAAEQPEMPIFKFVTEGSSAIYVPPADLIFKKLMLNPMFKDTLRFDCPYDKSQLMPMWIMVRSPLISLVLVCSVVSSRSKQLNVKCHYLKLFEII